MEWEFTIEQIDNETIKITDMSFNLSPWVYAVKLGAKWHNVFIDGPIIKFKRDISYYFNEVNRQPTIYDSITEEEVPKKYICKVALDLYEFKKLEKIDKINPGSAIAPCMPGSIDIDRMEKLEKELNQKQKQLIMLSSKLDNLENLLKKTLGL